MQANLIQKMQVQGLLNIQPEYKRAEIDPTLWSNMTYNIKSNFADGLAIYCGNNDGTNNGFFVLLLFYGVRFNNTKRNILMNLNETIFGTAYLVGKSEYVDGKHRVKNITLMDYMKELNFIDHPSLLLCFG